MVDKNITALTAATTPLAGTEVLPIVQSGTEKVSVANLTAGRAVTALSLQTTDNIGAGVLSAWGLGGSGYRAVEVSSAGNGIFAGPNDTYVSSNAIYSSGWKYGIASYASQIRIADGNFVFYTAPLGAAPGNPITFTQRFSVLRDGTINFTDANLVQGTAAKGINFTANTPAAGMTSRLLNWYEEGTWTPTQETFGTWTSPIFDARYVRIGRSVTINVRQTGGTVASVGTSKRIGGLPFATTQPGATGVASNGSVLAVSTLLLYSDNFIYFVSDTGSQTSLQFSLTYQV